MGWDKVHRIWGERVYGFEYWRVGAIYGFRLPGLKRSTVRLCKGRGCWRGVQGVGLL